jgi:hypothetical protein
MHKNIAGQNFTIEFDYATDTGPSATVLRDDDTVLVTLDTNEESAIEEGIAETMLDNGEITEAVYREALGLE